MKKIKSVVGYCRVSSDIQREQKTIRNQETAIKSFCKQHRYRITKTYKDDGISGMKLAGRPGFRQLLSDAHAGKFQAVVVFNWDRITRDDFRFIGEVMRAFHDNGIVVMETAGQTFRFDTPEGRLLVNIASFRSASEREAITRRMREGKAEGLRRGRWTSGAAPFGFVYDKVKNAWSHHPDESPVYLSIVDELEQGESLNQILKNLFRQAVKTRRGKDWSMTSLTYMLRNPAYRGTLYGNKSEWQYDAATEQTKLKTLKPETEWMKIDIPPLISPKRWERIQVSMDSKRRTPGKPPSGEFLLKGFLRCGHCGSGLYIQRGARPEDVYYHCGNRRSPKHRRTNKHQDRKKCILPYLRTKELDRFILSHLSGLLSDPDHLIELLFSEGSQGERVKELAKSRKRLEWEVGRHRERRERLLALYVDGNWDRNLLDKKMSEIKQSLTEAQRRLGQVQEEADQLSNSSDRYQEAKKRLKNVGPLGEYIQTKMEEIPFDDRRSLIEAFFEPDDYIELHTGGDFPDIAIKGLPPLILSWRSVLDIARLEQAARQVKLGKSLKVAMGGRKKGGYIGIQDESPPYCLP